MATELGGVVGEEVLELDDGILLLLPQLLNLLLFEGALLHDVLVLFGQHYFIITQITSIISNQYILSASILVTLCLPCPLSLLIFLSFEEIYLIVCSSLSANILLSNRSDSYILIRLLLAALLVIGMSPVKEVIRESGRERVRMEGLRKRFSLFLDGH